MTEDIGYLDLTLYKSVATICVKAAHISMFYRKDDQEFTTVHLQGALDFINVREEPLQIAAMIRELHPDYR